MSQTQEIIRGSILLLLLVLAAGGVGWFSMKRSRDPGRLLANFVLTGIILSLLIWFTARAMTSGGLLAIVGLLTAVVAGLVLAIIWVPLIVDLVGRKIASLYD